MSTQATSTETLTQLAHVTPEITWIFTAILAAMILSLALEEKIHAKKSLIVGLFAVIGLIAGTALNIIPFGEVILPGGHQIEMPVYIPAVDWGVIG